MRKNTRKLFFTGLAYLFLTIVSFVFFEELKQFGNNSILTIILLCIALSIINFGILIDRLGKGNHLQLDDLVVGKEYILIDHISIKNSRKFSIVGIPNSDEYITVDSDDRLFSLPPGQSFVMIGTKLRKLS